MAWPPIVVVIGFGDAFSRAMVLEPMIRWLEASNDSIVPFSVVSAAPGVKVVPARAMILGPAVMAWPAMVVISWFVDGSLTRGIVLLPMTRAGEQKCIGVPDMVMGGAPLVRVEPAIAMPFEAAVKTWPAILAVNGAGTLGARSTVEVPTTRADESKRIGVPETVRGGAPGIKVVPAMEMPCETGRTTWLLIVLVWSSVEVTKEMGLSFFFGRLLVRLGLHHVQSLERRLE